MKVRIPTGFNETGGIKTNMKSRIFETNNTDDYYSLLFKVEADVQTWCIQKKEM